MANYVPTQADEEILTCLSERRSFSVVAGAGAGKTTSLVEALRSLIRTDGPRMLRDGQQVVCITYTNRAARVISERLQQNPLFVVSTLHSFLWGEIRHFQKSIRESLRCHILPGHIAKQKEKDNGGKSKAAIEARGKVATLEHALQELDSVPFFRYGDDTPFSDYLLGELGHDDLLLIASDMITTKRALSQVLGQKYPYFFVDEAQDTSPEIVNALNVICSGEGPPIIGYFGDPMQQIYDEGKGDFAGPPGSETVTKVENFRSAPEVVTLLNAFRTDVTQVPAGKNASEIGSVGLILARSETPEEPRRRYSEAQLERATRRLDEAVERWGWAVNTSAKQLFLARRMIARRLGFLSLHDLFTGPYASTRAKNDYESGEHFLLKPLVEIVVPLARADSEGNTGAVLRLLSTKTVAFSAGGQYNKASIGKVKEIAKTVTKTLVGLFYSNKIGDVIRYCYEQDLIHASERLIKHLNRVPRGDVYNEELHSREKADWLADTFFEMRGDEVEKYCTYLDENTPFSTQHGVKGEQYDDVIVVFDDIEAAWTKYSFTKMLTPGVSGEAKDSQKERSRKLAYVCFSRAKRNLRILLFTPDPETAKSELTNHRLFEESQVSILG
ncbi:DNA helicase IV [Symmachiella dynata]|uniref:DNA helicase IV n=1 Tax=Symmachiella dynata TaxID=2527995 RepID=A0A517ZRX0_9PLAN|nr:UvrD-helicase domain-containing protein [Symmachiella dynata]QDU45217.1 DNA helicase IV [Symmachiella dynata]